MVEINIRTDEKVEINGNQFKKPASDYYRLELIKRKVVDRKMTEEIETDYMSFVKSEAHKNEVSITKYIQGLIDNQMNKEKSLFRSWIVSEISHIKKLPCVTDVDNAILEELEKVLVFYDKLSK